MLSYPTTQRDYRFVTSGVYTNRAPLPLVRRRAAVKRSSGWGSTCPACGLARSCSNVCECNAS
jgi:hypothetical protein